MSVTLHYAKLAKKALDGGYYLDLKDWAVIRYGTEEGTKIANKIAKQYGEDLRLLPNIPEYPRSASEPIIAPLNNGAITITISLPNQATVGANEATRF